jgi:hypothetical protein
LAWLQLHFPIEKADFGTEHLRLPPHMVDLDPRTFERVKERRCDSCSCSSVSGMRNSGPPLLCGQSQEKSARPLDCIVPSMASQEVHIQASI